MSEKDTQSENHLKILQRIAEDIPSGVSADVVKSILNVQQCDELLDSLGNLITLRLNQSLERVWINYNISEKLSHLRKLEEASPTEVAWRPITGKPDIKHIVADCLMKEKQGLVRQIKLVKQETELLKPYLNNFREETKRQLDEFNIIKDACIDDTAK